MNYYSFHIGDYLSSTAHLEPMEDLAYRRLLDLYYSKNGQVMACDAARLVRMKHQAESVDLVIAEFFSINECGKLCHARCDAEIISIAEKSEKAREAAKASHSSRRANSERKANAKRSQNENSGTQGDAESGNSERNADAKRTQSERSADAKRTQSYPQKNSERNANAMQTHSERNADAVQTNSERNADAVQTNSEPLANGLLPLPNTQHLLSDESRGRVKRGTRFVTESPPPAEWVSFCEQERPDLDPLAVYARFSDFWIAKPGKEGVKLDWLATWRNWVRNEKAPFGAMRLPKPTHSGFAERDYTKGIDPVTGRF